MKGEIPVFRRCCFCLPLRYGLLAWGYFKMITDALLVAILSYFVIYTVTMISSYEEKGYKSDYLYTDLIVLIVAITVLTIDLLVTIVYIVGGHKKNMQLIRMFYFLSMAMWVVTFLLIATLIAESIKCLIYFNMSNWIIFNVVVAISFYFVVLVVQTYFLLLLRSEIIKLRNTGEFRFVNNTAEAECTIKCEEISVGPETGKEGV